MPDLIKLYLFALRSEDRPLATAIARALPHDVDQALQRLPRGPVRWSAGAQRVVNRLASMHP